MVVCARGGREHRAGLVFLFAVCWVGVDFGLCASVCAQSLGKTSHSSEDSEESRTPSQTMTVRGHRKRGYSVTDATTATRTNTALVEIPQSIQVVPRGVLLDQQAVAVREVLENVSGVQPAGTDVTGVIDFFTARGFVLNPTTNFYRNGRPFVFSIQPPTEMLERIEFLKGPASVLYGQAEPGGIVNTVLRRPPTSWRSRATLQVGNYDTYRGQVGVGGPLTETLGFRANASIADVGGFREFQDSNRIHATAVASWTPTPWFELTVDGSYQKLDQAADSGLAAGPPQAGALFGDRVVDLPISTSLNEPWARLNLNARNAVYDALIHLNHAWQLRHTGSWQRQDSEELRADPGSIQQDKPTQDIKRGDLSRAFRSRRTERRVLYFDLSLLGEFDTDMGEASVHHRFLLGADFFMSERGFTERTPILTPARDFNVFNPVYSEEPPPSLGSSTLFLGRSTLRQTGAFAQEQLTFNDWIHLLAGLRFDWFQDELQRSRFDTASNSIIDQTQSSMTLRGGAVAQPTEAFSVFLSYAEGFRPNLDRFTNSLLEPERSNQIEIGVRLSVLDRALLATLTAYNLSKTNVAITNPVSQVLNVAGRRRSRGIELDVVGRIANGLNVVLAYALLDAKVLEGDPRPLGTPGVGTRDISGNRPPGAPTHSARLWLTYRFEKSFVAGLRLGAGTLIRTEVQGDIFNSLQHPGFTRLDAMLGWAGSSAGVEFDAQVNFRNLSDISYFSSQTRDFVRPGEPFTVLGRLSARF